ncbi:MAG: hypothetical protein HQM08_21715 [Candidatus Riflebacteria bacterium]|nr:hypothetical protein [Candidatus Riflebacteria bacterium]
MRNDYFSPATKNVLILQCGVVDCAPRPLPRWLRGIVSFLPALFQKPVVSFIHNNRPRIQKAGFIFHKTPPLLFTNVYQDFLESVKNLERVYVFNIPPTNRKIEKHSPGFTKSIIAYNQIIEDAVKKISQNNIFLLDVYKEITSIKGTKTLINEEDGHHITVKGHELYAKLILEREREFPLLNP